MSIKSLLVSAKNTLKEKSPEILIGVGIVSVVAGVVFACKATLEIDKIKDELKEEVDTTIEKAKDKMEEIDEGVENEALESYTEESAQHDKVVVYAQSTKQVAKTGLKVAKAYAPSIGLIVTGLACILLSHKILRDRNATLIAAYTALDTAFKAYRARVRKDGGEALDHKYLYGTKTEMREVTRKNPETGLEETVIESEEVIDYPLGSPYARIYDETHCEFYEKADPHNDWNLAYLKRKESYWNDKLKTEGIVFLNDVYKDLGLKISEAGQFVGWSMDNPDGDHEISFDIYKSWEDPRFKAFKEPGKMKRIIVLDFNVDGDVTRFVGGSKYGTALKNDLDEKYLDKIEEMEVIEEFGKGSPEWEEMENERWARANK